MSVEIPPQTWSVIVFGYNERESLAHVVDRADRVMVGMAVPDYEVIVVDDGSTDGSVELARELGRRNPRVRLIAHGNNRGIGRALLSGYEAARFENMVAVPADGQFDCAELSRFAVVPNHCLVSFYREKQTGYSLFRKALSRANQWVNQWGLGVRIRDVNWVKIYKREAVLNLAPKFRSSLVESEICAKLLHGGARLIEVESRYQPRTSGSSRATSLRSLFKVGRDALVLYREIRNFKAKATVPALRPAQAQ